jgi:acyl transferase domain-containing protein
MSGRPTVNASDPVLDAIAVIGIGCRFSGGASSVEDFWQMLCEGRTGHGKIPSSRYESSAWHHPSHDRKGAVSKTLTQSQGTGRTYWKAYERLDQS